MRIRTVGVIAAIALTLAASACGNDSKKDTGKTIDKGNGKLVIWADTKRTAALKPFADQFATENGVTVEVKEISENLQQTFVTASQQGNGPDVVVGAHDWIGNLVQNGAIDPVNLTADQKSSFADVAIKAVTFDGKIYGAPYAVESVGLVRNTDLAPTAPATMEDLITSAQALKTAGKVSELLCLPIGQAGDAYHIYPLYSSAGGSMFGLTTAGDPDPKNVTVGSADSQAAFAKLKALGEKGIGALKTSIGNDNLAATFASKKCAYAVTGAWNIATFKSANIKYDITAVPGFAGMKPATPFVGVQSFFVASKGKSKALAQEFVTNYVTNKDFEVALYNAEPRVPALTAATTQVGSTDTDVAKWQAAAKDGLPMPAIPEMSAIWGPFGNAEAAVVKGGDPKTAAEAANKAIVDAINK